MLYSYEDLQGYGRTPWDGVRNYQARNFMRDEMQVGDAVLFYHSNVADSAVVGVARVAWRPIRTRRSSTPTTRTSIPKPVRMPLAGCWSSWSRCGDWRRRCRWRV